MRVPTALLTGALVAAAALAGGRAFAARTPPPPCPVAVLDLSRVYSELPRVKQLEASLQQRDEELNAQKQKDDAELGKQVQDLEARFEPGSAEYEKGRKSILMRSAELEIDLKREKVRIQERRSREIAAFYKEICAEAERIATERGFACVLTRDGGDIQVEEKGKVLPADAVKQQMIFRTVLWADPSLDLTKDVLEAMKPK